MNNANSQNGFGETRENIAKLLPLVYGPMPYS